MEHLTRIAGSPDCWIRILCHLEQLRQSPALQEILLHRRIVLYAGCYDFCCAGTHWCILALQQPQECLQASNVCQICSTK